MVSSEGERTSETETQAELAIDLLPTTLGLQQEVLLSGCSWDCLTPFKASKDVIQKLPQRHTEAPATWSETAMPPTGQEITVIDALRTLSGEEDAELFGEFEVSKEDLQPASTDNEARRVSGSSKRLHATSNMTSVSTTSSPAGLQRISEPGAKSPSHASLQLCETNWEVASDPPLSPSVDGSNDSPTLASSVTFAGWESQGDVLGYPAVAPEAVESDDAESWLSAQNKQSSNDAFSSRTEPQTKQLPAEVTTLPSIAAGPPKDSRDLSLSPERQQLQPAGKTNQPLSSPTLQLDLTQQVDTRQLVLGHPAEVHQGSASSSQGASLPVWACHSAPGSGCGLATSLSGQHAPTASQPTCRDHSASRSQHVLSESPTHQGQPSSHEASSFRADPMQHRALSGFLTPLGKLAGMFGWTPGKPNRPLDRVQMSQAAALDHVHPGRKQLSELHLLAEPANTVSQEVSASMLQANPHQFTLQQLQDLQKAADLLTPRSISGMHGKDHSPAHAVVSSSMCQFDASVAADRSLFQQPRGQIGSHVSATSDRQLPSPPAARPDGSPDARLDSSSDTAKVAAMHGWEGDGASSTQDDEDMLAAALASRLARMAPHISSLHGRSNTLSCIDGTSSEYHCTLKRQRSGEAPKQQQGQMQVTDLDLAEQAKMAALACRDNHDVQHVLQHCPHNQSAYARKRFHRTTGLEVLQRCMPSLWQNNNQTYYMNCTDKQC